MYGGYDDRTDIEGWLGELRIQPRWSRLLLRECGVDWNVPEDMFVIHCTLLVMVDALGLN